MAFRFTFELLGVPLFDRAFNRVSEHIRDLRPVWDHVEKVFYDIEEQQFRSEGARGNGRWQALSPAYAKVKAKRYPGKPILQARGALYESLTRKTDNSVLQKDPEEFAIGTSLFYAQYHQTGGRKLPKRPPIDFSESQRRELTKGIQVGLLTLLRRDLEVSSVLHIT